MHKGRTPAKGGFGKPVDRGTHIPLVKMLAIISCLVVTGVFFCATMVPDELKNGPSTNSILSDHRESLLGRSLSQKIMDWLPKHHNALSSAGSLDVPDYSQEFWSPIDVDVSHDSVITLCKLNFKAYSQSPHLYPMFKDLEANSACVGTNRRREKMSVLLKEVDEQQRAAGSGGNVIQPTGFVFHESRVGSTLVANTLASDPFSMVFSESAPAANALLHCETCSRERNVKLFRDVVTLMGRSPIHKRLFFKFQSITSTKMDIALEAFPNTPFIFVYRQPVQTMMSHLDPLKGSMGAPCLRSMRNPPDEVRNTISTVLGNKNPPKEAWCAAHLNMLCTHALSAYERYGVMTDGAGAVHQRGMLVNYDALPGIVARAVLPMFGVAPHAAWLAKMAVESQHYSKGRGNTKIFSGDSQDKDERATKPIVKFATSILMPSYEKLVTLSEESLRAAAPREFALLVPTADGTGQDWKVLSKVPKQLLTKVVPIVSQKGQGDDQSPVILQPDEAAEALDPADAGVNHGSLRGHSFVAKPKKFVPWIPFSNSHSSKSFEPAHCPPIPPRHYPKAFSMIDITNNWNPDSTDIPPKHYDTLCHFDYQNQTQLDYAYTYREREVPFVVYNIPEVDEVAKKWNDIDYLQRKLGKKSYRTETSPDNHFMYWRGGSNAVNKDGKKWKPPTGLVSLTFEDWIETAVKGQNKTLDDRTHQYFRVSSDMGNEWLFDELPFFKVCPYVFYTWRHFILPLYCFSF